MAPENETPDAARLAGQDLVLSSLEPDQLVGAKREPLPRRRLHGREKFALWMLRLYLLFMMAVVVYQVWTSAP